MLKLSFIFGLCVCLSACDKIDYPIEKKNEVEGSVFIEKNNLSYSNSKKVLLEDYTGHTCGNCPPAAEIAEQLSTTYGSSVVVLAVHAGFFARVKLPDYPVTYTSTAGNDWDGNSGFGVSAVGNPNGMVNRKDFGGGRIQKESTWSSLVNNALKTAFILKLDMFTAYDSTVRALNTRIKATFKTAYPNPTKLCLVIYEDHIVGAQTDYRKSPDLVPQYEFNHVLRGSINGSWGIDLTTKASVSGDTLSVSANNFNLKSEFKDRNIVVAVIAYDALTREVLQVDKLKIRD